LIWSEIEYQVAQPEINQKGAANGWVHDQFHAGLPGTVFFWIFFRIRPLTPVMVGEKFPL
jgi:hypothetical protein